MELDPKRIGNNLMQLRHRSGLTQRQVAEFTGMTHQHVSAIEAGKAGILKLESIIKFSVLYKCSIYEIITFPVSDDNKLFDDNATYRSLFSGLTLDLQNNPILLKFIYLQVKWFSFQPTDQIESMVALFEEIIKLTPEQRAKLLAIINNIRNF